jgi:hypothetical protein
LANDAAIIPLPNDDVTPPVTKMYLAIKKDFQVYRPALNVKWK